MVSCSVTDTDGSMAATQLSVPNLESGACMSYPPSSGSAGKTVFIDPGHGGPDNGVVGQVAGQQVREKDATLAVAGRLRDLLRADGYRVVMSRTIDSSVMKLSSSDVDAGGMTYDAVRRDLETRVACANAAGASALLSIHFNGLDDPSVAGSETFYDSQRQFAASSKSLAQDLQSALVSGLGATDRGVFTDDEMLGPALTPQGAAYGHLILLGPAAPGYLDQPSQMPGALVEPLFVTNPTDAAVLADRSGQQRVAKALESGLLKYLSAKP